jgi:hypothetical protein
METEQSTKKYYGMTKKKNKKTGPGIDSSSQCTESIANREAPAKEYFTCRCGFQSMG